VPEGARAVPRRRRNQCPSPAAASRKTGTGAPLPVPSFCRSSGARKRGQPCRSGSPPLSDCHSRLGQPCHVASTSTRQGDWLIADSFFDCAAPTGLIESRRWMPGAHPTPRSSTAASMANAAKGRGSLSLGRFLARIPNISPPFTRS
jgi:hypothetical protein